MTDALNNFDDSGLNGVDALVQRWAAQPIEIDWAAFHDTVMARATAEVSDAELEEVDQLLSRWGGNVTIDDDAFAAGVLQRIRQDRRQRVTRPRFLRLAMPLAVAAAVALAVVTTFWSNPHQVRPYVEISIGPAHRAVSTDAGHSVVRFDREPAATYVEGRDVGIALISVGASPLPVSYQEFPPL